ncbi:hypothetical protein DH2020_045512 [Rehmannia glutinosa]|uniref:Uncharacterized protein n=1 Tax=Rehmannia glutinosa TaxID=99300 RepID=A0ABR0UDZ1_REHGL
MVVKNVMHMNGGDGGTSYANNSGLQKIGILKAWHVLDETLKDMFMTDYHTFSKCFKMVDLGCSSGPNTLLVISRVIDKIEQLCKEKNYSNAPEFKVFLNDLTDNDFNNLFKMLPEFYEKLNLEKTNQRPQTFISGLPGSFYGRLLPTNSLNLVYSSYSLQWLSQIPQGLESNRENIHMAMSSPPEVFEAYKRQHQRDFSTFLISRGEEMVAGGRMVLTFVGRSVEDPSTKDDCAHFTLLANTLLDMIPQGLIKKADLHSFNMPIYTPCKQEVEAAIREEGSFTLDKLECFLVPWDAHVVKNGNTDGELVANFIRAYTEPVIATHFGSSIIDDLYGRYAKKLAEYLSKEEPSFFNMVISLTKK